MMRNQVISTTGFGPRGRPKGRAAASPLWKPHRLCARGKPRGIIIITIILSFTKKDKIARLCFHEVKKLRETVKKASESFNQAAGTISRLAKALKAPTPAHDALSL
ncbi:MAG: hypothetical protein O7B35_14185 [Deltaproteobacteria bacterium]|nr:hypothetical protein [Deltaproteobacteria bacterium]